MKSLADFQRLIPNTALEPLGAVVVSVDEKGLTLRIPITAAALQPFGLLHGGISLLLAESAASMQSAWDINPEEVIPVGIEINANHVRSISRGSVTACAQPVYVGRRLSIWAIEIKDDRGRLVSTARCTMMHKPGRALPAAD